MQVIYATISPFKKLLGKQKVQQNLSYRPLTYLVKQSTADGLLLYNNLTKALVRLTDEEALILKPSQDLKTQEQADAKTQLIKNWFLVPEAHDDRKLCQQMRQVARMIAKPTKGIREYTIFTTMDCNARCFYCYEMGRPRTPMSEETAHKTADYIIRHCAGQEVKLAWFGGEPLYNKPVITLICNRLKEAGVNFHSTMTSNGYLMDDETIQEATGLWNLKGVQITLDGTEEVYNHCKAYIYKDVNAYRRVIGNIHHILDAGIHVKIRLNIDRHNAKNLQQLVEELGREFAEEENLEVYSSPLFGSCMKQAAIYRDDARKEIYAARRQMQERLISFGITDEKPLKRFVSINHCMADNDGCIIIVPSGHIGKCEHYLEDSFIGHINQEDFDKEMVQVFKEVHEDLDICQDCADYPNCVRLKKCEGAAICFPEVKAEKVKEMQQAMLEVYERYKNRKQKK